jgi:hypothetical protein
MQTGGNMKFEALGESLEIVVAEYSVGGVAVQVVDEEGYPFATVSVNLPETKVLPAGAFYVKHWSENAPLVEAMIEQGILEPVDAPVVSSGFISGIKAYCLKGE